jgi:hypothetical protein
VQSLLPPRTLWGSRSPRAAGTRHRNDRALSEHASAGLHDTFRNARSLSRVDARSKHARVHINKDWTVVRSQDRRQNAGAEHKTFIDEPLVHHAVINAPAPVDGTVVLASVPAHPVDHAGEREIIARKQEGIGRTRMCTHSACRDGNGETSRLDQHLADPRARVAPRRETPTPLQPCRR